MSSFRRRSVSFGRSKGFSFDDDDYGDDSFAEDAADDAFKDDDYCGDSFTTDVVYDDFEDEDGTDRFQRRPRRRRLPKALINLLALSAVLVVAGVLFSRLNILGVLSGHRPSESKPAVSETVPTAKPEGSETMQAAKPQPSGLEDSNRYFRRQLSGDYTAIYDVVLSGLQNRLTDIKFEIDSKDNISFIVNYVLWDYPELFWVDNDYSYSYTQHNGCDELTFNPKYVFSANQAQKNIAFVEDKVESVAAVYSGLSDYEKVKGVYEYVINNTVYDINYSGKTVYELFSKGRAVCEGYARATQYILRRLGVESVYTTGDATNSSGRTDSHAWLKVQLDGEYYNLDVTWGDPTKNDGTQALRYDYLCVTDADLSSSHVAGPNPYPPCTATQYNYYVMENRVLSTYDKQLLLTWFSEDVAAGKKLEFRTINSDVYRQTLNRLFDGEEYYDIAAQVQGLDAGSCSYSANDQMNVISISY